MNEVSCFERVVRLLGLHESDIQRGVLNTGDTNGPTYFSSYQENLSAVKVFKFIRRIDDLKEIVGSGPIGQTESILQPWPTQKDDENIENLSFCEEKQIYHALQAYLLGDQAAQSYVNIIKKLYFPMRVGIFAAEEIVIEPDHPLILQGHDPLILNFKTATLQPGAQIICEAPVIMTVDKFIKNV